MRITESKITIQEEPGRYYLGDPHYAISDER